MKKVSSIEIGFGVDDGDGQFLEDVSVTINESVAWAHYWDYEEEVGYNTQMPKEAFPIIKKICKLLGWSPKIEPGPIAEE